MRATHFLTRSLRKVATKIALAVLAYNLTRVMNIVGVGPLIAAMRASIEGCVLNQLSNVEENIIARAVKPFSGSASFNATLRRALIRAAEFFVSSMAPASAVNSRVCEMAKRAT